MREMERLPKMRQYVLGVYRRPTRAPSLSDAELDVLQEGHLAHLRGLRESGSLIVYGPVESPEIVGILVFSFDSTEEARRVMEGDPKLRAGLLQLELSEWYAAEGLEIRPTVQG